jgi:hypothetical protein
MEFARNTAGALVDGGSTLMKWPMPGKKKSSGDTLWLVLTPLQPAPNSAKIAGIASSSNLQLNLTCPV